MYEIFPLTIPMENSTEYEMAVSNYSVTAPGLGRTATTQGGYQMLALVVTLIVALVGGALTGK